MFATFIDKEDLHNLDLSALISYPPDQLMYYYYNSWINVSLETYLQLFDWLENGYGNQANLKQWIDLIDLEINARSDLIGLQDSEYLDSIGPYYYGPTGTQLFFSRSNPSEHEALTSSDFAILFDLHKMPTLDKRVQKYYHNRKNAKRSVNSKDEIIRDIALCADCLEQIEKIERHSRYLNILLEWRKASIILADSMPQEPQPLPEKPSQPLEPPSTLKELLALNLSRSRAYNYQKSWADYNRNIKIYFIRYREYEKACDRYKEARQSWQTLGVDFIKKCHLDREQLEKQLNELRILLETYQNVIRKSPVHPEYQSRLTLLTFKRYLETGRADDVQACINLYEEERLWTDIKASQERIEKTIYYLQPDNDALILASEETSRLIASARE